MTEEELIQLGEDAEALLKSEPFNRVINKLVEQTFQSFVNSQPEQSKERSILLPLSRISRRGEHIKAASRSP